jgi:antitoxin component YwqK of YwqJK toxin-antitoxin module
MASAWQPTGKDGNLQSRIIGGSSVLAPAASSSRAASPDHHVTHQYVDGVRVGTWRHLSPQGRLRSEGGYAEGQLDRPWTWWRTDGSQLQEGAFDNGVRMGRWRRWSAVGALLDEGEYQGERKVGTWVTYHPDGSVKATKACRTPA